MSSSSSHYVPAADQGVKFDEASKKWIFKPRHLSITWGNDARYWKLHRESDDPADLLQVCWLEVTAVTADHVRPGKKYEISFTISMKQEAFGWKGIPVLLMAKIGRKGKYQWTKLSLPEPSSTTQPFQTNSLVIEVPENHVPQDPTLHFGLYEVWTGKWKGGLQIHKAEVKAVN